MSFGWSVGDAVDAIQLLIRVAATLKEIEGGEASYRTDSAYLLDLANVLERLKDSQAGEHSIKQAKDLFDSVGHFRQRIDKKFQGSLGTDVKNNWLAKLKKAPRKIQYGLFVHEEVDELRKKTDIPLKSILIQLGMENIENSQKQIQTGIQTKSMIQDLSDSLSALSIQLAPTTSQQFAEITKWLNPIPFEDVHHRLLSELSTGSCEWILKRDQFHNWRVTHKVNERYPLLWVTGAAGCGKTHMATKVIEALQFEKRVVYFYCDAQDLNRRSAIEIMRNWSWQMLRQDQSCLSGAMEVKGRQQLASEKVLHEELLKKILLKNDGAILVIDAFDECEVREHIKLYRLFSSLSRSARILVFSRPLQGNFHDLKKQVPMEALDFLEISAGDTYEDINHYIEDEVTDLGLYDEDIATQIVSKLQQNAKGMFLWAALMIEELRKPRFDESELLDVVEYSPRDLDTLYQQILQNISFNPKERATSKALFQLLLFALRPLSIQEVGAAMKITSGEQRLKNKTVIPDERLREIIGHYCGPLVSLHKTPKGKATVTLVHYSLKEYLLSTSHSPGNKSPFEFNAREAHSEFAQICLTYLCYDNIEPCSTGFKAKHVSPGRDKMVKTFTSWMDSYPLLQYSALNWWWHIHRSSMGQATRVALLRFCTSNASTIRWLQVIGQRFDEVQIALAYQDSMDVPGMINMLPAHDRKALTDWLKHFENPDPLKYNLTKFQYFLASGLGNDYPPEPHVASFFDIAEVLEEYIAADGDVNQRTYSGMSPLSLASRAGSVDAMMVLIRNGADVDSMDCYGATPLVRAVYRSLWGTPYRMPYTSAEILLAAGADPCLNKGEALRRLCLDASHDDNSSLALASAMLERGARKTLDEGNPFTPLQWTARKRNVALTQLLLDNGAQVNVATHGTASETALLHACAVTTSQAVVLAETLLKAGASVKARSSDGRSALHLAARHPVELCKLLLDFGAAVDSQSNDGFTPLHDAVTESNLDMIRLLISRSASLDMINASQQTPLLLAIEYQNTNASQILREAGAMDLKSQVDSAWSRVYYPRHTGDISKVSLILRLCAPRAFSRHTIRYILNIARYWLVCTESNKRAISLLESDCQERPPYLTSSPINVDSPYVREIEITIWSRDQGYSGFPEHQGTYENSWTWFDLWIQSMPGKEDILKPEEVRLATNVHAGKSWRRSQVTYSAAQDLSWVKKLGAGDRLSIVPMARYPEWKNFVREASIKVYTSCWP
ncbi:hypothetical protein N7513_005815 [Penicillium frequentans]|nr:hypothetical protein N7513_005815 [Penicillium glabrum]